jgi:hypothetical protein
MIEVNHIVIFHDRDEVELLGASIFMRLFPNNGSP